MEGPESSSASHSMFTPNSLSTLELELELELPLPLFPTALLLSL